MLGGRCGSAGRDPAFDRDQDTAAAPGGAAAGRAARPWSGSAATVDDVLPAGERDDRRPAHLREATTRHTQDNRSERPFTRSFAVRPGEIVRTDTSPLDVMALLDDGIPGRVELTTVLDVATRTICAAVLRPTATKAVDAALLLVRTLVPEPIRPGCGRAADVRSRIHHHRLLDLDARLQHAAARPVIVPETIVTDQGTAFISATFVNACPLPCTAAASASATPDLRCLRAVSQVCAGK